jgi:hypothetical protein
MNSHDFSEELAKVSTVEELAASMKRLNDSCELSLRFLQSWGLENGRPLPRTTVHDVLGGRRPPQLVLLRDFLAAAGLTTEQHVRPWLEALDRVLQSRPDPRQRSKVAQELSGPVSAARFFVEQDALNEISKLVQSAQDEIWLWGTTLSMHVSYLESYIEHAVKNGRQVKVLLIKPDGGAMQMSGFRAGPDGQSAAEQRERLKLNLGLLSKCAHPGLEVRLVDYLAPYTMYAYDPGLATGRMDLRLGSFHGRHELRPTFQLHRERDGTWFDYFYEQFAAVWKVASPDEGSTMERSR